MKVSAQTRVRLSFFICEVFSTPVLVGGFSEGNVTDIDGPYPSNRPLVASGYHYDCDSDLEDEGEKPEEGPDVTGGEESEDGV